MTKKYNVTLWHQRYEIMVMLSVEAADEASAGFKAAAKLSDLHPGEWRSFTVQSITVHFASA